MTPKERREKFVPRVCIFGGKEFAPYVQGKRIAKLITDVGVTINHDIKVGYLLNINLILDYNVSVAKMLVIASGLSQHISTARMEANGINNLKISIKGCVFISTLDGVDVEIHEEVGEEKIFMFGVRVYENVGLKKEIEDDMNN